MRCLRPCARRVILARCDDAGDATTVIVTCRIKTWLRGSHVQEQRQDPRRAAGAQVEQEQRRSSGRSGLRAHRLAICADGKG